MTDAPGNAHGLEKSVWTERDFEVMGWHDSHIHGFQVWPETFEVAFDIDYITRWMHPVEPRTHFQFWVAPATLVFRDVANFRLEIDMGPLSEVEILGVHREPNERPGDWRWRIELSVGEISFDASGFEQVFRREPVFLGKSQAFDSASRGGVDFGRSPYDQPTAGAKP